MKLFRISAAVLLAAFLLHSCASTQKTGVATAEKVPPAPKPVFNLQKGDRYEVISDSKNELTQEVMGQTMEINATSLVTNNVEVKEVSDANLLLTNTTTKVKSHSKVMDQEQDYDSEKDAGADNPTAKMMAEILNKVVEVKIDPKGNAEKTTADSSNAEGSAMSNMMSGLSNDKSGGLKDFYAKFDPATAKAGDTWTDSTKDDNSKTVITYTIREVGNGMATVAYVSATAVNTTQENMGMEIVVSMSLKSTGTLVYDAATRILKQHTTIQDGSGTAEAGGMSIPITMKNTISATVTKQ